MFKKYLKTALRNIAKNKIISFINIFGLSIGITFSILVFLFVKNEYSFDKFHPQFENIYRVLNHSTDGDRQDIGAFTPMRLADDFKILYPEIESSLRISHTRTIVRSQQAAFSEQLFFIEQNNWSAVSMACLTNKNSKNEK